MSISWHSVARGTSTPYISIRIRITILLRVYFKYDTKFCHCAKESLEAFFQTVLGLEDGVLGLVIVIYTFGDYARFTPIFTSSWQTVSFSQMAPSMSSQNRSQCLGGHFSV